jgi:hypothetical protein
MLEEQLSNCHKRVETVVELENELRKKRQMVEEMALVKCFIVIISYTTMALVYCFIVITSYSVEITSYCVHYYGIVIAEVNAFIQVINWLHETSFCEQINLLINKYCVQASTGTKIIDQFREVAGFVRLLLQRIVYQGLK